MSKNKVDIFGYEIQRRWDTSREDKMKSTERSDILRWDRRLAPEASGEHLTNPLCKAAIIHSSSFIPLVESDMVTSRNPVTHGEHSFLFI